MKYKISKELFEAVMGESEYKKTLDCIIDDSILYHIPYSGNMEILINDFFFACKEWAFWNDYEIVVRMRIVDIYRDEHKIDYGYEINHTNNGIIKTSWWIGSEQQAVFDACQWILDNKDK